MGAELPTGTVTFLFTDLEGSTRLWEQQTEAMQAALARHDELLAKAVESHCGHVVKRTGDGLHAVFATADAAVAAAVAGQRSLVAEPWGPIGELRVRMGLHTGTAEQRGGDYYGPAPNRAARLMGVAHSGQVLCSQATVRAAAIRFRAGRRDHGSPRIGARSGWIGGVGGVSGGGWRRSPTRRRFGLADVRYR